jgi:hypothetical protein
MQLLHVNFHVSLSFRSDKNTYTERLRCQCEQYVSPSGEQSIQYWLDFLNQELNIASDAVVGKTVVYSPRFLASSLSSAAAHAHSRAPKT